MRAPWVLTFSVRPFCAGWRTSRRQRSTLTVRGMRCSNRRAMVCIGHPTVWRKTERIGVGAGNDPAIIRQPEPKALQKRARARRPQRACSARKAGRPQKSVTSTEKSKYHLASFWATSAWGGNASRRRASQQPNSERNCDSAARQRHGRQDVL